MAPDLADLEKSLWDAADELRAISGLAVVREVGPVCLLDGRGDGPAVLGEPHPELQIINDRFDDELAAILEDADLVRHFVGRGFLGKAMFVAIDKTTAVRMYELVAEQWASHLAELRGRAARLPKLVSGSGSTSRSRSCSTRTTRTAS
ncbi:MAG TPA: hypothetical protein VHZ31_04260 [Solirubrobacteraceae bacterium]|nr:hypothetical protein [Solirubrobacteraceae bacterium]